MSDHHLGLYLSIAAFATWNPPGSVAHNNILPALYPLSDVTETVLFYLFIIFFFFLPTYRYEMMKSGRVHSGNYFPVNISPMVCVVDIEI